MDITKQTSIPSVRNGGAAPQSFIRPTTTSTTAAKVIEAQGYSVGVVNRLEALITGPEGKTSIFSASLELVTPQTAESYLARMRANRRVAGRQVDKYARAMEADRWRPTNQGIAFDADGYLIDGQHRCHAVIRSGKPAVFLVVRGLPTEVQHVVDGNRVRVAGDQLNIAMGTKDGKLRVATARVMYHLRNGWMFHTDAISNEEAFNLVATFNRELDWVLPALGGRRRRVTPAPVMGAWAYAYGAAPQVAEWAESYVDGSGLSRGDPLLLLRESAASTLHGTSTGRMDVALKTLRALWARLNGEPIRRLYASTDGLLGFAKLRGDDIRKAWDWYGVR